jgi:subtilase family serine protease
MKSQKFIVAFACSASSLLFAAAGRCDPVIPNGAVVTATPAMQAITFSVYLPLQNKADLDALVEDQQNPSSANYHKWLTAAQFSAKYGPTPASVANVTKSLQAQGFTVLGVTGQAVQMSGTAALFAKAFSTSISTVAVNGRSHLLAMKALQVPAALKAEGASLAAFTMLPRMHTRATPTIIASFSPSNRYTPTGGYMYDDLKQAYDYPSYTALDGTGVNVAVVMGNDVLDSDVAAMFNNENFTATTGKPPPAPAHVFIDGGAPFDQADSFESSLDVQQVLGGAPGAKVTLVDLPDLSEAHILDGYNYVVNAADGSGKPFFQLVNSSFGECELFYGAAYNNGNDLSYIINLYNSIFEQGNAEGITFVASSGDSGGLSCPDKTYFTASANGVAPAAASRFVAGVEFPASSPYVTAVGGTNLITTYNPPFLNSAYVSENGDGDPELPYDADGFGDVYGGFWGAGGGVSAYFKRPTYQALVNTGSTFRTTPDVGMQVGGCPYGLSVAPCGPNRSYVLTYDSGIAYGVIGTSVSSPEFVGALALYVERTGGGVGNVNRFLYSKGAAQTAGQGTFYNRNIPGFDGKYTNAVPSTNYNYIVGNGTPRVRSLFDMTDLPAAGAPQTPSNP